MSSLSPVQKHMNLSLIETEEADDDFDSDVDETLLIATRLYPTLDSNFFISIIMPIEFVKIVSKSDHEIGHIEQLHFVQIRIPFVSKNIKDKLYPWEWCSNISYCT